VHNKGEASPYSITERRFPELIPVLGSQRAGDVSHKPGGRLPLLSTRPVVTHTTQFCCLVNTMGVNSLPKTVTRQRCGCDLNPGPSAPESSTLTTRLPSHPHNTKWQITTSENLSCGTIHACTSSSSTSQSLLFDAIQQCRVDCHDVLVLGTRVAISDSVLS